MNTARRIAFGIAAVCGVTLLLSGYLLAKRIEAWHDANPRKLFYAIRTDQPDLEFAGRPVSFQGDLNEDGEGVVTLTYGERGAEPPPARVEIPVEIPKRFDLPGLDQYIDWMHVYLFAENEGRVPLEQFRERVGEAGAWRLVAVVRRVDPEVPDGGRFGLEVGDDEWGWGEVMRHRWTFTFHELRPDGTIDTHTLRMPESGRAFYRRQVRAVQLGEPMPRRDPSELEEGSWEWDLALRLMPRPPAITKENQALLAAGWTLPLAAASAIGLFLSLGFGIVPSPRARWNDDERSEP